jgi:hypothetical protein
LAAAAAAARTESQCARALDGSLEPRGTVTVQRHPRVRHLFVSLVPQKISAQKRSCPFYPGEPGPSLWQPQHTVVDRAHQWRREIRPKTVCRGIHYGPTYWEKTMRIGIGIGIPWTSRTDGHSSVVRTKPATRARALPLALLAPFGSAYGERALLRAVDTVKVETRNKKRGNGNSTLRPFS